MVPETLRNKLQDSDALCIDVREPDEFAYERIAGTLNIPQSSLSHRVQTLPRNKEVYLVCSTGMRSAQSLQMLRSAGFDRVQHVEGGLDSWKRAGLPIERSKGPLPIMRQVQIIAGSLILVSFLIPPLRWISAVVGTGLLVAGATGFCGMAKILAYLPWNKSLRNSIARTSSDCGPTHNVNCN